MKNILFVTAFIICAIASCNDSKEQAKPTVEEKEIPFSIIGRWEEQKGNSISFDSTGGSERKFNGWSASYTYVFTKQKNNPYILFTDKSIWKIVSRWDIKVLDTNKFCQVQYPNIIFIKNAKNIIIPKSDFPQ